MQVCDDCQSEDITYEDRDGIASYCMDCYDELDKEYIEAQGIERIGKHK